jgi:glycosyltransferase involved in cell wall biosynthesis
MSKVSVLIPAFNAAKYLPVAIDSVVSQTLLDWQIMLVNDGSTDDTDQVVAPYLEKLGNKIRYIKQENRGLPAARNTGIRESSGEYLALLDADDIWLPSRLSESVEALSNKPQAGLSYALITQIDPEGHLGYTFPGNGKHGEGRIAPYIYMRKIELPCPTLTFRRKCLDEVGLFDETMRATEDRDLWLRIALKYEVAFVPKVLAYYRISPQSMSADPERMLRAQRVFIRKHFGQKGCGVRPRQIAWARAYKQHAEALSRQKRPWDSLKSAMRALALYPFDLDNHRTAVSLTFNWIKSLNGL